MRDKRFIAEHRGGHLKIEEHRLLMTWGYTCVEHILPLLGDEIDERLTKALIIAKEWERGNASVGDARKASMDCIVVANELSDPVAIAVARAVGHAVATAHMADHSPISAWYALKAVIATGKPAESERKWQDEQLQPEIRELVLSVWKTPNI